MYSDIESTLVIFRKQLHQQSRGKISSSVEKRCNSEFIKLGPQHLGSLSCKELSKPPGEHLS